MGSFANELDLWTSTLVEFMLGNPLKEVGLVLLGFESKFTSGFRTEKIGWPKGPGPSFFIDLAAAEAGSGLDSLRPLCSRQTAFARSRLRSGEDGHPRATLRYSEAGRGLGTRLTHVRTQGTEDLSCEPRTNGLH